MSSRLLDKAGPSPEEPPVAALALIGRAVCEAAVRLNTWSLTLVLPILITGIWSSSFSVAVLPLSLIGFVLAICQMYCAWRLAFDRPIFAAWARLRNDECLATLPAFDAALRQLLKKNASSNQARSMLDRVIGVRRLHVCQIAFLVGQVLALLALMTVLFWESSHA